MAFLKIQGVTKNYEGVKALDRVSFEVKQGTIKGLMGPNGAGKSTLFHLISGIEKPDLGKIFFKEKEITSLKPHEISLMGIGRTFQTLQVWGNMTVVENVMTAMHSRLRGGVLSSGLWLPWIKREEDRAMKEAKEILEFLGLFGRWKWFAGQLSYSEQRILEIGRALGTRPELLLLDEPAAGLTYGEAKDLSERLDQLRKKGITILLIEHHMGMMMEIADEIVVLSNGILIAEGTPEQIRTHPRVIEAYLKRGRQGCSESEN